MKCTHLKVVRTKKKDSRGYSLSWSCKSCGISFYAHKEKKNA